MKGFVISLQFLTRLPTPRIEVTSDEFGRSMRWFPAAGFVIGLLVAGSAWAGALADAWVAALAALVCWVAVTGALHLDGLSDLADAAGAAHKDRERLLAVMADPHLGSFGAVVLVMQLMAKLVLLHSVVSTGAGAALVLVPFAARIGPLVWSLWLPPLHDGLGARFSAAVGWSHVAIWAALLAAGALAVPAMLVAPVLIASWGFWLKRRIGGVSGDCHGAGIELAETGLLLALVVIGR